MSIPAAAETPLATTDAQVIADMAAAVLATVARLHADGMATVTALAEAPRPIRVELPPVAEALVETPAPVDEPTEAELIQQRAEDEVAGFESAGEEEPVIRIAEQVPAPGGRHLAEAETTELPAQHAA